MEKQKYESPKMTELNMKIFLGDLGAMDDKPLNPYASTGGFDPWDDAGDSL